MNNQSNNKGLKIFTCILCVLVVLLSGYIIYDKIDKNTNTDESNKVNDIEDNTTSENNQTNETENSQTNNNEQTNTSSTITYTIDNIKTIQSSYNYNDSDLVKAQKMAKELMDAVNNKDYYYLAKIVGNDADYFIKYGIYNYTVDINDYTVIDNEYIFTENYETSSPIDVELGQMLIITFEDGGRITIDPNCTGI